MIGALRIALDEAVLFGSVLLFVLSRSMPRLFPLLGAALAVLFVLVSDDSLRVLWGGIGVGLNLGLLAWTLATRGRRGEVTAR